MRHLELPGPNSFICEGISCSCLCRLCNPTPSTHTLDRFCGKRFRGPASHTVDSCSINYTDMIQALKVTASNNYGNGYSRPSEPTIPTPNGEKVLVPLRELGTCVCFIASKTGQKIHLGPRRHYTLHKVRRLTCDASACLSPSARCRRQLDHSCLLLPSACPPRCRS